MPQEQTAGNPTTRRYSIEEKQAAVRMVRALHMIAVCRLRYCARTRAYAQRRLAEGKTKPEILRCLKRYIARELYPVLTGTVPERPTSPA